MKELEQEEFYKNEKIEFDMNPWLLGFESKVLDVRTGEFREHRKEDYVSMSTGYEWREPEKEECRIS